MARPYGLFVTFDGPNYVGKSTLLDAVAQELCRSGSEIYRTKEPTVSLLGDFIRQAEERCRGRTLACLVGADRYSHLEYEVLPMVRAGKTVLSDRYVASSLVLQRIDGVELSFIWMVNSQVYMPDLSVVLVASVEVLEERLAQRKQLSRFERTTSRERELEYYLEAAEFLSGRGFDILLLENGDVPVAENANQVCGKIKNLMARPDHGKRKRSVA